MVNMGGCHLSPLWVPPSLCRWVWTTKGQAGQYLSFLSLAHGKLQKIHEVETAHHAPSSSVVNRVVRGMCYGLSTGWWYFSVLLQCGVTYGECQKI